MPSSWRLVWCHERCHKQEFAAFRQALADCVAQSGGSLVCLRKAKQLEEWANRTKRPPFTLITGWGEAKPCLRALSRLSLPQASWPVATLVSCEEERQSVRANRLADELGLKVPIVGRLGLGLPGALAQEMSAAVQQAAPKELLKEAPFTMHEHDKPPAPPLVAPATTPTWSQAATLVATKEAMDSPQGCAAPMAPIFLPFFPQEGTERLPRQTAAYLVQALEAATPDYYED